MRVFYNDNDSYVAEWLGNLIAAGHLPQGTVDARSTLEIDPTELGPFRQCHFFAGIGGWPYALCLANWPDDQEVWTASCPCQPLSSAGQRRGHADERHLWPALYHLIAERRPATIFGEQVASKDGREWLAGVRADLEGIGYAVGAADLCAASAGAPHIRQRLFWVGNSVIPRLEERSGERGDDEPQRAPTERAGGAVGGVGDAAEFGLGTARGYDWVRTEERRPAFWSDAVWLPCLDGKARRTQPGIQPLAHGVSARVGRLRAYGNAIVPQVAAEFAMAFMEGAKQLLEEPNAETVC